MSSQGGGRRRGRSQHPGGANPNIPPHFDFSGPDAEEEGGDAVSLGGSAPSIARDRYSGGPVPSQARSNTSRRSASESRVPVQAQQSAVDLDMESVRSSSQLPDSTVSFLTLAMSPELAIYDLKAAESALDTVLQWMRYLYAQPTGTLPPLNSNRLRELVADIQTAFSPADPLEAGGEGDEDATV